MISPEKNAPNKTTPFASIIIPAWNGRDYLEACLNSLLRQEYPHFEVIVVDNASTDGTSRWLADRFPEVRLIQNEQNLGFAGGVNVGLRAAAGEALILFNQDAVAEPGWLATLAPALFAAPDIGIAGCKILNIDSPTIQHGGGYLIMPQALPGHFGVGEQDRGQCDAARDVDFVTGAALAIRRDVVEKIGYLDETFFFYYEDVDYCYRARAAGFRVVYKPAAVLRHHDKASLGSGTTTYHAHLHTARLQLLLKHWGGAYFTAEVQAAEQRMLSGITEIELRAGLGRAYKTMLEGIDWMKETLQLDEDSQAELLAALRALRREVYAAYPAEVLQPPGEPEPAPPPEPPPEPLPAGWWEVHEQPLVSHTPVVGPFLSWFRTAWNNISTKWYVRAILGQQNRVNHRIVKQLESREQASDRLARIMGMQGQILGDLDYDQTRLTVQLTEILYRLDNLEARVVAFEQQRHEQR